jgi:hypothetical protein
VRDENYTFGTITSRNLYKVDMADDTPKPGRSITSHLDITIDSLNPLPAVSQGFTRIREQATIAWTNFETAEVLVVQLDDKVDTDILNYVTLNPRVNASDLRLKKAHFTIFRYEPRIQEAQTRCHQLEDTIKALEDAALKEPETLEGRVTLEIDVEVMRSCLATTREIVQVAQAQLNEAKRTVNSR